jgi:hypothetical protein
MHRVLLTVGRPRFTLGKTAGVGSFGALNFCGILLTVDVYDLIAFFTCSRNVSYLAPARIGALFTQLLQ